jgi:hypothetical protein
MGHAVVSPVWRTVVVRCRVLAESDAQALQIVEEELDGYQFTGNIVVLRSECGDVCVRRSRI